MFSFKSLFQMVSIFSQCNICISILSWISDSSILLFCRLTHMWRTMHECHHAQTIISQQLSHLSDNQRTILNSENHHQAILQLAAEVTYWYDSFCKLVKSQREYVKILCKWVQLTNCLMDEHERSGCASMIRSICEQWDLGLDSLPDKVLSTNSFVYSFSYLIFNDDKLQLFFFKIHIYSILLCIINLTIFVSATTNTVGPNGSVSVTFGLGVTDVHVPVSFTIVMDV